MNWVKLIFGGGSSPKSENRVASVDVEERWQRSAVEIEQKEVTLEIYRECLVGERHFNDLQSVYRRILSVWLIGALTAVGFIASKSDGWPLDRPLLAGVVFLVSSLGIGLLWCVDLLVYQRLLDSYFFEGLSMEAKHDWLPRLHHRMQSIRPRDTRVARLFPGPGGNLGRAALFYAAPTCLFLAAGAFCLGFEIAKTIMSSFGNELWSLSFAARGSTIEIRFNVPLITGIVATLTSYKGLRLVTKVMCLLPLNARDELAS